MSMNNVKSPARQKTGFFRLIRRMKRDEKGATALEFGIVAIPFILLIVALLETALVHMTTLDLENAVKDASRQIRTGQAQVASFTADDFRELMCDNISLITNCKTSGDLIVDVRSYEDFETISVDPADLYDEFGNFIGGEQYNMGSGLKVVVVRTYYKIKLHTQVPAIGLANVGNTHRMINAIAVFRNEPFS